MKSTTNLTTGAVDNTVVSNAIRTAYNLNAIPRLRADWNLNRYTTPTADNVPAQSASSFDPDIFPASSMIEPLRPNKGAPKAILGQATAAASYTKPYDARFYVGDDEDLYKYWISPDNTNSSGVFPLHTDSTSTCRPYVLYPSVLKANKIVLRIENTWATPKNYRVYIRTGVTATWVSSGWTQISSNAALTNDGTLTLYYNGTSWVTTRPDALVTTNVAGIMMTVDSMKGGIKRDGTATTYLKRTGTTGSFSQYTTDGSNSRCSVISIEPHFEVDLTNRLQGVSDTFDMGDADQLYPIGAITTNIADITLSNEDGIFDNENASSPYYKLMEPNVEFNMEYIFTVNGTQYSVQQFKLYGDVWDGQYNDTVSVSLEDYSRFLKLVKPLATMYEGKTGPEIIWRILDSVGFTNYQIDTSDLSTAHTIPIWWTDGTQTAWELLDTLAHDTQTAIYFDARGVLQVKTRDAAFDDSKNSTWTLYGQVSGNNLTDIVDIKADAAYESNNIDVKYKNTKWRVGDYGDPALAKVWEPSDETLVVRSSPLKSSFTKTSTTFWLPTSEIELWPYSSKVNIDGEILSYEGKQFVYYTYTETKDSNGVITYSAPVQNTTKVLNDDEKKSYDSKTPYAYRSKNYLTGAVYIKARGLWNSDSADHSVDVGGWSTAGELVNGSTAQMYAPTGVFYQNKDTSTVKLHGPASAKDADDTYWVWRGSPNDTGFKMYGTRMRFLWSAADTTQRAGIFINANGSRNNGYYIELRTTSSIGTNVADSYGEVMIYSKKNGKYTTIALGARVGIEYAVWYDVDVRFSAGTSSDSISVWLNGQRVAGGVAPSASKQPTSGKFGMYLRGKSTVEYEYIYAVNNSMQEPADNFGYYDLVYGGMRSGYWIREAVYQLKTRVQKIGKKNVNITYKLNDYFFDEFGPYIHEIREFEVKFDPNPVQYSSLFSTNNWYTAVLDYLSTPFSAKFTIANVARKNAVLHGEDSMVFTSAEATINEVCTVLGRDLDISDEEVVNVKNAAAIRARGQIDTEVSGSFIQTKEMAEAVSTWIAKHWSEGLDSVTATVFGNPLIEIGDIVVIDYARKNMTPATHKYFVTGANCEYDNGIGTTLTLRRVRTAPDANLTVTP